MHLAKNTPLTYKLIFSSLLKLPRWVWTCHWTGRCKQLSRCVYVMSLMNTEMFDSLPVSNLSVSIWSRDTCTFVLITVVSHLHCHVVIKLSIIVTHKPIIILQLINLARNHIYPSTAECLFDVITSPLCCPEGCRPGKRTKCTSRSPPFHTQKWVERVLSQYFCLLHRARTSSFAVFNTTW